MPFLQVLYMENRRGQYRKQNSCGLIPFPYLTYLDLQDAQTDYAEVFLLKKNTYLSRLLNLRVYEITTNVTKDPTDFNFKTLKNLDTNFRFGRPDNFHDYFSVHK